MCKSSVSISISLWHLEGTGILSNWQEPYRRYGLLNPLNIPFREGVMLSLRDILRGALMHSPEKRSGYTVLRSRKRMDMKNGGNSSRWSICSASVVPAAAGATSSAIPFTGASPGCASSARFAA